MLDDVAEPFAAEGIEIGVTGATVANIEVSDRLAQRCLLGEQTRTGVQFHGDFVDRHPVRFGDGLSAVLGVRNA